MISNELTVVLGHKGSGKSRWLKGELANVVRPVVIWDRLDEYTAEGSRSSDPVPGCVRFADLEGRSGLLRFLGYVAAEGLPWRSAIVAPDALFLPWCKWAWLQQGIMLVVEEVDSFCSPDFLPKELGELVRRGRHQGLDLAVVSRAPAEISRDLTRQADREIYFRLVEWADLEWLRRRCGQEVVDTVSKLPPGLGLSRRA